MSEAVTLTKAILDADGVVLVAEDEQGTADAFRLQDGIPQAEVLFPLGVGDPDDEDDDEDDDVTRWVPVADLVFDRGVSGLLALVLVGDPVTAVDNTDGIVNDYRVRLTLDSGREVTLLAARTTGEIEVTIA